MSVPHVRPLMLTVQELRNSRSSFNQVVVRAVKQLPFSQDVLPQVLADCGRHFMSSPRALTPEDMFDKLLTRRIPVREERAHGWRTRVVDHEPESGVNMATTPVDKIRHDTLDVLSEIVLQAFRNNCDVRLWEAQAF